jgi:hypothetical protein
MRRKPALLLVLAVLAAPAAFAVRLGEAPERPKWVAREILVGYKDRVTERSPSLEGLFRRFGVSEVRAVFQMADGRPAPLRRQVLRRQEKAAARRAAGLSRVYRLTLAPDADVEAAAAAFRQDPHVEFAEPNALAFIQTLPDDSFADPGQGGSWKEAGWGQPYADLWGLARTGWAEVWERQAEIWPDAGRAGGGGITVAVIDTGVDYRHPDLAANVWRDAKGRPGRDFVDIQVPAYLRHGYRLIPGEDYRGRDYDPSDHSGHGTHVAGTIAAVADNGAGIAGVAW